MRSRFKCRGSGFLPRGLPVAPGGGSSLPSSSCSAASGSAITSPASAANNASCSRESCSLLRPVLACSNCRRSARSDPVARSHRPASSSMFPRPAAAFWDRPALIEFNRRRPFFQAQRCAIATVYAPSALLREYRFRRLASLRSMPLNNAPNSCAVISRRTSSASENGIA
jgi:hypothetical protein